MVWSGVSAASRRAYNSLHILRLAFPNVVSDDRRWSTFSGGPAYAVAVTATTVPATAATPLLVAATSGAPIVAASAWASSKNGGSKAPPPPNPAEAAVSSHQPI